MSNNARMQTRQMARNLVYNKHNSNPSTESTSHSVQKQDRVEHSNITLQKVRSSVSIYKRRTNNGGKLRRREMIQKIRVIIVGKFSKMQFLFGTSMESLFLAIDIFDKYLQKHQKKLNEEINDIALACFMLAVKYEEIYPPTLEEVQGRMKTQLSFKDYVTIQFYILGLLDYNLALESPIKYINKLSTPMTQEKCSFAYLYLELAVSKMQIRENYTWKEIMDAIRVLYLSRADLERQENSVPPRIATLLRRLIQERSKLHDAYPWLSKKYSNSRLHSMAYRPSSLGDGFQILEANKEQ